MHNEFDTYLKQVKNFLDDPEMQKHLQNLPKYCFVLDWTFQIETNRVIAVTYSDSRSLIEEIRADLGKDTERFYEYVCQCNKDLLTDKPTLHYKPFNDTDCKKYDG